MVGSGNLANGAPDHHVYRHIQEWRMAHNKQPARMDRPDGYCEERINRNGLDIPEQIMKRLKISIQKPIAREGFHHIFTLRNDGTITPSLWFDNFITWGRWIK